MQTSKPVVKDFTAKRVIGKKEQGFSEEVFGRIVDEIIEQINKPRNLELGVRMAGPPMFICFNEDPVPPGEMSFEIAFPVSGNPEVDKGFEVHEIPTSRVISMTCTGAYNELTPEVYGELYSHASLQALQPAGPPREIYHTNPSEVPPDQNVTELQLPVA